MPSHHHRRKTSDAQVKTRGTVRWTSASKPTSTRCSPTPGRMVPSTPHPALPLARGIGREGDSAHLDRCRTHRPTRRSRDPGGEGGCAGMRGRVLPPGHRRGRRRPPRRGRRRTARHRRFRPPVVTSGRDESGERRLPNSPIGKVSHCCRGEEHPRKNPCRGRRSIGLQSQPETAASEQWLPTACWRLACILLA